MNGPRRVRFLVDDPYGLWQRNDLGWELGLEAGEDDALPVWRIRLDKTQEEICLEDPYRRGLLALQA